MNNKKLSDEEIDLRNIRAIEAKANLAKQKVRTIKWIVGSCIGVILFVSVLMIGLPVYKVWQQEMSGKAEFAKAEQNRRIMIEEAKANLEAQKLNAMSEVERAKGVKESNEIISDGLKGNEEYLRYLWIQGLKTNNMQVLYIPTEAGLPILEAGKRP